MASALQLTRARLSGMRRIAKAGPEPSRTGIWIGLAAITMTFAAFTSAMIVRRGAAADWQHFTIPGILYLNTLLLAGSSMSLAFSRKQFSACAPISRPLAFLAGTLGLGLIFVVGQYLAWIRLRENGLQLASSPSISFFYVFTGLHALHVLGGIGALSVVICRLRKQTLEIGTLDATSRYWHFMTFLWFYLLLLLRIRI